MLRRQRRALARLTAYAAIAFLAVLLSLSAIIVFRRLRRRTEVFFPACSLLGQPFPKIHAETLAGTPLALPAGLRDTLVLMTVRFSVQPDPHTVAWLTAFRDRYHLHGDVSCLDLIALDRPDASAKVMRAVGTARRNRTLVARGPADLLRRTLCAGQGDDPTVYLIDRDGTVLFQGQGWSRAEYTRLTMLADAAVVGMPAR